MKRIGYWMSEKKSRKLNLTEFSRLCRENGLELIQIDLSRPLADQGPFNVILHKLTDVIAKGDMGDQSSKLICKDVEEYLCSHPEIIVIDPLNNVRKLLDRYLQYKLIEDSGVCEDKIVFTPTFVELTTTDPHENLVKLKEAGIKFPFVCKPSVAHGSSLAHQMALIFNEDGVCDVRPPCVAQTFVNHNALLYKIYVIGSCYYVVERPSLKNFFRRDHKTIFFDSHDVSKANSSSSLTELDEEDMGKLPSKPCEKRLNQIVSQISIHLGMALFGIDIIIENKTGRYAIIDMNAFPGYDGVPEFFHILLTHVIKEIEDHSDDGESTCLLTKTKLPRRPVTMLRNHSTLGISSSSSASCSLEEINVADSLEDSGVETGDSSDERASIKCSLEYQHYSLQLSHQSLFC